jgi:hypothetical protein
MGIDTAKTTSQHSARQQDDLFACEQQNKLHCSGFNY